MWPFKNEPPKTISLLPTQENFPLSAKWRIVPEIFHDLTYFAVERAQGVGGAWRVSGMFMTRQQAENFIKTNHDLPAYYSRDGVRITT